MIYLMTFFEEMWEDCSMLWEGVGAGWNRYCECEIV